MINSHWGIFGGIWWRTWWTGAQLSTDVLVAVLGFVVGTRLVARRLARGRTPVSSGTTRIVLFLLLLSVGLAAAAFVGVRREARVSDLLDAMSIVNMEQAPLLHVGASLVPASPPIVFGIAETVAWTSTPRTSVLIMRHAADTTLQCRVATPTFVTACVAPWLAKHTLPALTPVRTP